MICVRGEWRRVLLGVPHGESYADMSERCVMQNGEGDDPLHTHDWMGAALPLRGRVGGRPGSGTMA